MDVVVGATPLVPWTPPVPRPRLRFIRVAGGLVGAGASLLLALGLALLNPFSQSPGASGLGLATAFAMVGASMFLPAAIGGAIVAPLAWRARSFLDWLGAIALLAVLAVLIGAITIAITFVAGAIVSPQPVSEIGPALAGAIVIVAIGLLLVGPFVLPFTAAGAVIWAIGMWLVRGAGSGLVVPTAGAADRPRPAAPATPATVR